MRLLKWAWDNLEWLAAGACLGTAVAWSFASPNQALPWATAVLWAAIAVHRGELLRVDCEKLKSAKNK